MTAMTAHAYGPGEFHAFDSAGRKFIYLVSSGAVFELDQAASELLAELGQRRMHRHELIENLAARGYGQDDAEGLVRELYLAQVIVAGEIAAPVVSPPPADFPLASLVMNITNQCNLSCTYCYEFGADKIATPQGKPKYMDLETARASVDFLLRESRGRRAVHITFFGGETLMNFKLLREVVSYAREQAAAEGRTVDFSLTTNATLLTAEIIAFLSDNAIGVTVSMDGPADLQDRRRVYKNGRGSYARIEPRLRALIAGHRTRAITARVTLTDGVTDVLRIYRHLKDDLGFHEVGFAPVTSSGDQDYSVKAEDMESVLAQFQALAREWLEYALQGRMHGFSNVSETIGELVKGVNKSHPCGAAIGLVGVSPGGDISPCHRFTDADTHTLGHISTGIDKTKQQDFLARGHVSAKYECQSC
ncbi:quinohemoprotein amine dehydrogenase maturation protein, partial [Phenylobacterium sp. CCH9-H3]